MYSALEGALRCELKRKSTAAMIPTATPGTTNFQIIETWPSTVAPEGARAGAATEAWLEAESRANRFRPVRISDACWYLRFRSFSKALLMIRSSSEGRSGLSRTGDIGTFSRIELKMTP